jgi:hypothetical protein
MIEALLKSVGWRIQVFGIAPPSAKSTRNLSGFSSNSYQLTFLNVTESCPWTSAPVLVGSGAAVGEVCSV